MSKELLLLRNVIRSIIKESQSPSEELAFFRAPAGDKLLGVAYDLGKIRPELLKLRQDPTSFIRRFKQILYSGIVGMIALQQPRLPCNKAYEVKLASGPGRGRLVYGMGYHMARYCLLIPDRTSVSYSAQDAWKKIRKKTTGIPLEDVTKGPPYQKPHSVCDTWKVGKVVKDQEAADALNSAYCRPPPEYDYDEMERKNDEIMQYMNINKEALLLAMVDVAQDFFNDNYVPPSHYDNL